MSIHSLRKGFKANMVFYYFRVIMAWKLPILEIIFEKFPGSCST